MPKQPELVVVLELEMLELCMQKSHHFHHCMSPLQLAALLYQNKDPQMLLY
jgi:hypothetical protein